MDRTSQRILTNQLILPAPGQVEWTTPGTYFWIVPAGVFWISAACIGAGAGGGKDNNSIVFGGYGGPGGALRYARSIAVVPGETLTIIVGAAGDGTTVNTPSAGGAVRIQRNGVDLLWAGGGKSANASSPNPVGTLGDGAQGGDGSPLDANIGGGDGGNSGYRADSSSGTGGGGGGAGGYSGIGGRGQRGNITTAGENGTGGAGAGGSGNRDGGGVGLYGEGVSGTGAASSNGGPGSGGMLKLYGGGGRGATGGTLANGQPGGAGAARIIWPAPDRSYPSTRTANE